jgi:V8-like Glu-specific endopeptidase
MNERCRMEQELRELAVGLLDRNEPEREVLHNPDQRTQVNNTEAVPFRFICHLEMRAVDTTNTTVTARSIATGVLVGPRHVLTTAHTLLAHRGRFKATHAWVSPGLNGGTSPFGRVEATVFRTHPNWFRNNAEDEDYDYGMITLKDAIGERRFSSLGNKPLGWWGDPANGGGTRLVRLDPAALNNATVNVAGYPDDQPAGTMWMSSGQTTPLRDPQGRITTMVRRLPHNADTVTSQSGSPVWIGATDQNPRYLVGLHAGAIDLTFTRAGRQQKQRTNVAIRATREFLNQIAAWK